MFVQHQISTGKHSKRRVALLLIALALLAWPGIAAAQPVFAGDGITVPRLVQTQKALQADERQKKMEGDAAKLVEMAQQLKLKVDKTNKNVLSVDVIRDAERIEKLAREVREGMRQ